MAGAEDCSVGRRLTADVVVLIADASRVLEIPMPRCSTYRVVQNNLPLPENMPASFQEPARTSPVFYSP
jgi:hypothetical protein